MDIAFSDQKLEKECNDQKLLLKRHGALRAKKLRNRLDDLATVENLEEVRILPQHRCHELHGDRAGQLSIDLDHPYRLIFTPAHEPVPCKPDGGLDWKQVTAILILGIEDTHA